ncbi:DUF1998 domain-containing protein [Paenibacillus dakarensis]|uniref:DUF1998 domain-containing protein n=1 Tax=Paenibacillus dakarensis TaxID=1527293 RepID=UPI0006D53B96|nr:DUF1998 domain-containing protein [Paenibacillus dakarensis]
MKDLPLRRSQLVTTFGPGALVVSPEGETAIIGSLDKWFYNQEMKKVASFDEYEVQEPRLKSLLNVKKLLLPPDFRPGYKYKKQGSSFVQTNTDLYIPLLRFPTWHFCPKCKTLHQAPMSSRTNWLECRECNDRKKMIQVPFVIVCSQGHISEFPWREWVHSDENAVCGGSLKLLSTGGTTLDSLKVKCSGCGEERSLRGIMTRAETGDDNGISMLGRMLNKDKEKLYQCPGNTPWFGSDKDREPCSCYPIAVLKNASNVYFPRTLSAIHLPGENLQVEELLELFEAYGVTVSWLESYDSIESKVNFVRRICPPHIQEYSLSDIETAIAYVESSEELVDSEGVRERWVERELRKKEFEMLIKEVNTPTLKIAPEWDQHSYDASRPITLFSNINRVTKLKETIVLTGFGRLDTGEQELGLQTVKKGREHLFKNPNLSANDWLPAFKVYGEGIFFTINTEQLLAWEKLPGVQKYFNKLLRRFLQINSKVSEDMMSPSYVLLHTLAHVIIDQLALTCGYNSTSIRERLYLDKDQAGILIYTSSGDSEGTFGGLVRMGKQDSFFPLVQEAIERAGWCSSDPICTEIGMADGQGLHLLNGAACHSCCYLPETSCELGNLFLDRVLLVHKDIGFFRSW